MAAASFIGPKLLIITIDEKSSILCSEFREHSPIRCPLTTSNELFSNQCHFNQNWGGWHWFPTTAFRWHFAFYIKVSVKDSCHLKRAELKETMNSDFQHVPANAQTGGSMGHIDRSIPFSSKLKGMCEVSVIQSFHCFVWTCDRASNDRFFVGSGLGHPAIQQSTYIKCSIISEINHQKFPNDFAQGKEESAKGGR